MLSIDTIVALCYYIPNSVVLIDLFPSWVKSGVFLLKIKPQQMIWNVNTLDGCAILQSNNMLYRNNV